MAGRGYSWPPFQPGNELQLRHGAYSPRRTDPLAVEIAEHITAGADWLRPCDALSVHALARTEARLQLVSEWLEDHGGDIDGEGEVRGAAILLDRLEARAESLRSKLGLDPLSRARLGRDIAVANVDLARLWAAEDAEEANGATDAVAGAVGAAEVTEQADNGVADAPHERNTECPR